VREVAIRHSRQERAMWMELNDTLGHRTIVNMAQIVSIKSAPDGHTILETSTPVAGAPHVIVVRESIDEVLRMMEDRGLDAGNQDRLAQMPAANGDANFVSDGNEG
jgi:uncharacterized protein YlzI (FlbEa/FlbD family)